MVEAFRNFAACVRAHGASMPEPNLSGHGEVFNTNGSYTRSPGFKRAVEGCEADLLAILSAGLGRKIPGVEVTRR
jgi:hypothetical protein